MKALVFEGILRLKELPKPSSEHEGLLRMRKAGICGTDLAISSGTYMVRRPIVLGHELFGVVQEIPEGAPSSLLGKRAVTEINVTCGRCYFCTNGMKIHCERVKALGIHRNGGFTEYVSVPVENLHRIPDSIADDEAVFVEPLAAAIELVKMGSVDEGRTCAVVGPGRLGLLVLQVLRLTQPGLLVAIGRKGKKLELAKKLGADEVFDISDAQEAIKRTNGIKFDHVVEATGNPHGVNLALNLVRPRGTLHLKSTHGLPVEFDVTKAVVNEVRIQGSRCGPFDEAINLLRSRKVKVRELITHRFRLDEFRDAFDAASSKAGIKVLFEM